MTKEDKIQIALGLKFLFHVKIQRGESPNSLNDLVDNPWNTKFITVSELDMVCKFDLGTAHIIKDSELYKTLKEKYNCLMRFHITHIQEKWSVIITEDFEYYQG